MFLSTTRISRRHKPQTQLQAKQSTGSPKKITKRPQLPRADRVLSNRGYGSRSQCFAVLQQGRVQVQRSDGSRVVVQGPSDRIDWQDKLWVDGTMVPTIPLLLLYHKPKYVLSVTNDPQGRPILQLPPQYANQADLHPVGRLDYDSSGLLLYSSNGGLTQTLLHPSHNITKEYEAIVEGVVQENELRELLVAGVETAEGTHTADLLHVQHLTPTESLAVFTTVRSTLPPEYNVQELLQHGNLPREGEEPLLSKVRLTVSEGKHRMVRRMLANCGHGVVELKRTRLGVLQLGDLAVGAFRELSEEELEWAQDLVPRTGPKKRNK